MRKFVAAVMLVFLAFPVMAQPRLDQALCEGYVNPTTGQPAGPNAGVPTHGGVLNWNGAGTPMVKIELSDPEAVCNDGSPAAIYVRPAWPGTPATPNPSLDRWVIHFMGGGGCRSFKSCKARWCDDPGAFLDNPGLMSSRGTFLRTNGTGILSQGPGNPLRGWNHVLLYYCSSDAWIGDNDAGEVKSLDADDTDGANDHIIAFKGAAIVEAAFDRLLDDLEIVLPNSGGLEMRKLIDAELVLLSGDSAGASGARMHADRVADRIRGATTNPASPPVVLLALEAGGAPLLTGGWAAWPVSSDYATYDDYMDSVAAQSRAFHGVEDSALDKSCLDPAIGASDPDSCFDPRYVQQNHITLSMFQRTDLLDRVANTQLIELGMFPAVQDYVDATYDDLAIIAPPGTEPRDPIAILGPYCEQHVAFLNNSRFQGEQAVAGLDTLADALASWIAGCVAGACPAIDQRSSNLASTSFCP